MKTYRRRTTMAPNVTSKELLQSRQVGVIPHPFIARELNPQVFCLGSCFALEIKKALRESGFRVAPWDYDLSVPLPNGEVYASDGERLLLYNTFTIRQEFEKAFGLWTQSNDDFWETEPESAETLSLFWDPYRRFVRHHEHQGVLEITRVFDGLLRSGILDSDVYIITLGLTEVWRKNNNGLYANAMVGAVREQLTFRQSTYEENYDNMKAVVDLVLTTFPNRKFLLTVSPIPLKKTFSGEDISVANAESKSILRAVAGRLAREYPAVTYFPSFEICSLAEKFGTESVYIEDGRHVRREMVQHIMRVFLANYVIPGPREPR